MNKNRLCIIGLAASHKAVLCAREDKSGEPKVHVRFNSKWEVTNGFQFEGKRKKNAVHLREESELCTLKVNNNKFKVRCGFQCKLLELNNRLLENPKLWYEMPASEGWLAVVQVGQGQSQMNKMVERTQSLDDYVSKRADTLLSILGFPN